MPDFILFMHDDARETRAEANWPAYFAKLNATGAFQGGSEIGGGVCVRKDGASVAIAGHLGGFIRIEARNLEHAQTLLAGNPVYEAGGTVEIRELPKSD
ncbi:hypothetical protein BH11PSE2_BH11PSE2_01070 [soil metagenome]